MKTTPDNHQNPFPGLRPFREDEEYLFFGRENQVDSMVDKLAATRFLAVVGTSGSGKSSLVNCGLRPALHGGLMARAGTAWRMAQFRPGSNPMRAMARALAEDGVLFRDYQAEGLTLAEIVDTTLRMSKLGLIDIYEQAQLGEDVNLLVVVDQFEELFRYRQFGAGQHENVHGISEESAAFVNLLLEAKAQTTYPIYVVLTMRSDFLGDCTQFTGLAEAINAGQYLVPRMNRDERRAAISGPVGVGGAEISPVLLTRLVNDVGDNPDQLSILQHALNRTWNQRERSGDSGPLDLPHYEAIGTMAHALDQHAERAYAELATARQQQICEKLFKALTDKATDPRGVRRPTMLGTLCGLAEATPAEVTQVIDVFRQPSRSFLMPPIKDSLEAETVIDISHESLMRVWERLKTWADEEAQSAHIYSRLAETAVLHGEGKAGLWNDPDLQVALDWQQRNRPNRVWAQRYDPGFEQAIAFLQASEQKRARDAAERERQRNAEFERARRELQQAEALAEAQQERAEAQRQKAEEQQQRLEQQARATSRLRRLLAAFAVVALLALGSTVFAFSAYRRAEAATRKAEAASEVVKQVNYVANMNVAMHAPTARVQEILDSYLPDPNREDADIRSFYWYNLWHNNHNELATLRGQAGVNAVAFSPDRKTLAFASDDLTVKLWDTSTEKVLTTLTGHSKAVKSVAFSPDGKTLASASDDLTVKLWDIGTEKVLINFTGHSKAVLSVAFSPDGKTLASASDDQTVKLWDTSTGKELATIIGQSGPIHSVAFSPNGKTLASASWDNTVKLWDASTAKELATLKGHSGPVLSVTFSPDGKTLASGSWDNTVKLWDASTRKELATLAGHSDSVWSLAFSPDGKTLASASWDTTVKLWDMSTRQELATFKGHSDRLVSVAFSPDGKTLASGSWDNTVKLWQTERKESAPPIKLEQGVLAVAFSPDGQTLASASDDKTVNVWRLRDTGTWEKLTTLTGHEGAVWSVAFSPDGKTLAMASDDKTVKLWDTGTWKELTTLTGHEQGVLSVAFSPDGKTLASAGGDKTVILWRLRDTGTWERLTTLAGHEGAVWSVAFSPDGKTLASASDDRTVKLWDTSTGKELNTLTGHEQGVLSVAFSPDGQTLASASYDQTVKLWNPRSGKELAKLKWHGQAVWSVSFSPDGRTLASASGDQTLKLWDTSTRKELATLTGHSGPVRSVAFSPNGKTLASAGDDKTVRLWIAATDQEVTAQRNK